MSRMFVATLILGCFAFVSSFSQFHMEVGARVGNSLIQRDLGRSVPNVHIYREEEKCKFGQSFGLDCTVGYDVRNLFGVTSGLSFDYLSTKEGWGGHEYIFWDVPDDQIPHLPQVYSREEYEAYLEFCREHSYIVKSPHHSCLAHVSMLTVPIELNKSIRLGDFCALRPTVGLGNSFVVRHKVYNNVSRMPMDAKVYVPTLLAGLDALLAGRWVVGVHIRRDQTHFISPADPDYNEKLSTRQLTVKLGWRIF